MMKKSVLPFALVCSALMLNPYMGGQAHAEVQNVQQAKAVKGTVVDETGEPVIGATVLIVGGSASQGTITDMMVTSVSTSSLVRNSRLLILVTTKVSWQPRME